MVAIASTILIIQVCNSIVIYTGTAAQLRQYFTDDKFWKSSCIASDFFCHAFEPSSSLLKAALITSSQPFPGYSYNQYDSTTKLPSQTLGPPPDTFQGYFSYQLYYWRTYLVCVCVKLRNQLNNIVGFGAVNLINILPLKDGSGLDPQKMLFVYDRLMMSSNSNATFYFNATSTTVSLNLNLSVSIAWTDPPPSPIGDKALVNNVDLFVVTPQSNVAYWGNNVARGDKVNSVEKVVIPINEVGVYAINIRANLFVYSSSQLVSIVATYPRTESGIQGPVKRVVEIPAASHIPKRFVPVKGNYQPLTETISNTFEKHTFSFNSVAGILTSPIEV